MAFKSTRREFVRGTVAVLAAPMLNLGAHRVFADTPKTYSTRAIDVVRHSIVIDISGP